ncbi:rare lipoprotein A [Thiothrix caldifontis]|jgi:rare lipoprotein A|uniref:Endolytic peptidoglycan transglycosylase RlpA n=2 Tax=Thiothrix caldifontis TaxID=525918 RepID=A0A1H3VFZ5_9GAMM|nr:rare lipoprotein A [Thiothrix caldifontis]
MTISLVACSGNSAKKSDVDTAQVHNQVSTEARSECGNDPAYTIDGKTYQVLDSVTGYSERGTAAWYGAEYQGTETAGCEVFDMYGYSAAHRTLPLPSFAKVTNQQNGKHIIVRINDRGPFESGDLIQLSFAAANALGIKAKTGAPVEVAAIPPEQLPPELKADSKPKAVAPLVKPTEPVDKSKPYYVIAGTWPDRNASLDMFVRLTSVGLAKTEMATAQQNGREMYQVRVGPLYNQDQIDNVKDILESNGLANFKVVAGK